MIIAVASGKGGVGKSTVALNLARELQAAVLVDGDLTDPDLPQGTGPTLHEVLAGRLKAREAVQEHGTVELLPCGRTLEGARAADLGEFDSAVEMLHRQYGWVVIDCPPGLARDVGVELHSADVTVVVTNPDRAALQSAHDTRGLSTTLETPVAGIALNRASHEDYPELVADIESEMGAPVTTIPRRIELGDTQAHGTPVRDAYPDSPVCDTFAGLAQRVQEAQHHVEEYARSA